MVLKWHMKCKVDCIIDLGYMGVDGLIIPSPKGLTRSYSDPKDSRFIFWPDECDLQKKFLEASVFSSPWPLFPSKLQILGFASDVVSHWSFCNLWS